MTKNYKLGEAAKYLDVYPKTLQKWDRTGQLVAHRTKTNRRYYTQEQLDDWLNKKKHEKIKKWLPMLEFLQPTSVIILRIRWLLLEAIALPKALF